MSPSSPPPPPQTPPTTKAWTFRRPGPYRQTLTPTTTHPLPPFPPPTATEEYLLLRISHAALNPADLVTLSVLPFLLRSHRHTHPAAVPALDFTATVLDVWQPPTTKPTDQQQQQQQQQSRFAPGDDVICFPTFAYTLRTGVGGLQGVVVLPGRYAVRVPAGRTAREGAGLLLAGCTADVQVVDYTQYKDLPGELARRFGDQPFDNIIDAYGNQEVYKQCARYLKPEGMYNAASIHYSEYTFRALLKSALTLAANTIWPRSTWLGGTGRTWRAASMMDPGLDMMERVVKQFGEGKLRVVVDSEWPFEKVHEALDVVRSGHAAGKVIIKVNED